MELGFLTDKGHGITVHLPRWCAGTPETPWIGGEVKNRQLDAGLTVIAYRCPQCEALRLYAPSAPK